MRKKEGLIGRYDDQKRSQSGKEKSVVSRESTFLIHWTRGPLILEFQLPRTELMIVRCVNVFRYILCFRFYWNAHLCLTSTYWQYATTASEVCLTLCTRFLSRQRQPLNFMLCRTGRHRRSIQIVPRRDILHRDNPSHDNRRYNQGRDDDLDRGDLGQNVLHRYNLCRGRYLLQMVNSCIERFYLKQRLSLQILRTTLQMSKSES